MDTATENATEQPTPARRRKHRLAHLILVVAVGVAAWTIGKPLLVDTMSAPPQAAGQQPGQQAAQPANVPPQLAHLVDPDNLSMTVTQANLWYSLNGTYAGVRVSGGTVVAVADSERLRITRVTADGLCKIAGADYRLATPVVVDPTGAACTDPAVAAGF